MDFLFLVRVVLFEVISQRCFAENVHKCSKVRAARAVFIQPINLSFGRVFILTRSQCLHTNQQIYNTYLGPLWFTLSTRPGIIEGFVVHL